MSENFVSITGNVTRDPEVRFTTTGKAVVSFAVAYKPYSKDGEGQVSFFDVTAWDSLAENVGDTLTKGMRVTVAGSLKQETWETKDGEKRSRVVITATAVGPDLRFNTATTERRETERSEQQIKKPAKKPSRPVLDDEEPF